MKAKPGSVLKKEKEKEKKNRKRENKERKIVLIHNISEMNIMSIVLLSSSIKLLLMIVAISDFHSFLVVVILMQTTTTTTALSTTNPRHLPISEAHELYCNHCHSSCKNNNDNEFPLDSALSEEQNNQDSTMSSDNSNGGNGRISKKKELSEEKIKLQCKCESVFDTKTRSITCKNMSGANGAISILNYNNKDKKWNQARLETSALAKSQQHGTI